MPTTTSKGYKLPSNGERGTWWQNIIDNFVRVNDHVHDGNDSQLLDVKVLVKPTTSIPAGSWVATSGGTYKQTVTLPTGITFVKFSPTFLIDGGDLDGAQVYPTTIKLTASTYEVYTNDNTQSYKVIYA